MFMPRKTRDDVDAEVVERIEAVQTAHSRPGSSDSWLVPTYASPNSPSAGDRACVSWRRRSSCR